MGLFQARCMRMRLNMHTCIALQPYGVLWPVFTMQYPSGQYIYCHSFSAPVKVLKVHDHVVSFCLSW